MILLRKFSLSQLMKKLANLQLSIIVLFLIGIAISLGTVIEQNQSLAFYKENYPVGINSTILNWETIIFFDLCNLYTTPWFLSLLAFFGLTLLSCTFTTQVPAFKKFRLWNFSGRLGQIQTCSFQKNIDKKLSSAFLYNIYSSNHHTFQQNKRNYSYSGLLGRIGPIFVHFSILMLLAATSYGSLSSYNSQELVPRGEIFHLHNLNKYGSLSHVPQKLAWRINDFWITYAAGSKTNQFYSDISLLDSNGIELKRKTIFVNEPFVYKGVTIYQTDWEVLGLKLQVDNGKLFQVPVKKSNINGRRLWVGSINVYENGINQVVLVVNDLTGKIFIYNEKGISLGEVDVGSKIQLNSSTSLKILNFVDGTGLQIKEDSSLKIVYIAFLFLMLSGYVSFISYSQIWGIEEGSEYILGGKANRAVLSFQENLKKNVFKLL